MPERGAIRVETARIVAHERYPGEQHVLLLKAPRIAATAGPGSFVHVDCGPENLLRRPMSIMGAWRERGEIELLFKEVGHGTGNLARLHNGDALSLIGPIGNAFTPLPERPLRLLLGGGVGIPPIVFFAEELAARGEPAPWVVAGSELPFPFHTVSASLELPGVSRVDMRSLTRLEERGIPNRLASLARLPGTFHGLVTELAETAIRALSAEDRGRVAVYACGPTPMLAACAALARRYRLPCQVSLEEYMACGVGGCAGCTVEVAAASGPAMKRVCVDGPVFDAETVFPDIPLPEPAEPVFD